MHMILTGPDNAGKTTLMTALREMQLSATLGKASVMRGHAALATAVDLTLQIMQMNNKTIWDRWYYPADMIYAPLVEGRETYLDVPLCIAKLQELQTVFVVVSASPEILVERYKQEPFYYADLQAILKAAEAYEQFCKHAPFPIARIDTTETSPSEALRLLTKIMHREETTPHERSYYCANSLFRAN